MIIYLSRSFLLLDLDSDCAGDLVCFERDGFSDDPIPPGCTGAAIDGVDYCFDPNDMTDIPTSSPQPSQEPSESAAPTNESGCTGKDLKVIVHVETDQYAQETSWMISNIDTNTVVAEKYYSATVDDYTEFTHEICLPVDSCFIFEIRDSYGDGILSPGGYELTVDGVVVAYRDDGGSFSYEPALFGRGSLCPTLEPSSQPSESQAPTLTPTDLPSSLPSESPAPTLTSSDFPSSLPSESSAPSETLIPLNFIDWSPWQLLGECEGDCDSDSDCASGLVCFHRYSSSDPIPPGCRGSPSLDEDYCYDASTKEPSPIPSTSSQPSQLPSMIPTEYCSHHHNISESVPCWEHQTELGMDRRSLVQLRVHHLEERLEPWSECLMGRL